jgi:DNA-binding GntR family transcriptional regulator
LRCGHNEHFAILDALKDGNGERAAALMLHHIDHIEADLDLQEKQGLGLKLALAIG